MRTVPARSRLALSALVAFVLALAPASALAGVGQTIVDKCAKGESFSGYTPAQYREALKDISTTTREYSECEREIRAAEAGAAGGGTGEKAGVPHTALTLSPTESKQVQAAHKHGSAPVQVGDAPIRPGVVHANIASAVNTLPHSLFAVVALLLAGAAALAAWEVRKRVHARRSTDN